MVESTIQTQDRITGIADSIVDCIGRTPMVRLNRLAVETDQQFIVLQLTVANNGPEAQLIDPSLFKLKDGQGNEFDPMVDGDMYVNQSEPFFLQDVYPGTPRAGNIVFEVPADAEQLQLIVQSGIGFEGDQAETITLPLP